MIFFLLKINDCTAMFTIHVAIAVKYLGYFFGLL